MRRNLLFYCYPRRGSVWPWHVDRLLEHQKAWNGRRIVVVATGPETDSVDEVGRRLSGLGAEILWRENDPVLAEARWFLEAFAMLESRDVNEATFYAHAKGTSKRPDDSVLPCVLQWSNAMYALCLFSPEKIESVLRRVPIIGCFRQTWRVLQVPWHFSGNFWWMRHDAIFSKDWKILGDSGGSHGVEAFPGQHFLVGESYCLTDDNIDPSNLYGRLDATDGNKIQIWMRNYLEPL